MRIGFFGDSFVYELSNPHSWYYNYVTYLKLIKDHYNAEVVNLGVGGSSYWDSIIKQFPPHENNLPDVCVFCWTDSGRVYHPTVRNLGSWLLNKHDWKDTHYKHLLIIKSIVPDANILLICTIMKKVDVNQLRHFITLIKKYFQKYRIKLKLFTYGVLEFRIRGIRKILGIPLM